MSKKVVVAKSKLNNIGDAIRNQLGVTTKYTLDEMPAKIDSITGGSGGGKSGVKLVINTTSPDLYGKTVYVTDGDKTVSGKFSNSGVCILNGIDMNGEVTIKAVVDGEEYTTTAVVHSTYETDFDLVSTKIYGVQWNGAMSPQFARTDDAIGLADPVPAVNGGIGSSPFDSIYPWSKMDIVEDADLGTFVKIPKFYFKWTGDGETSLKLQISGVQHEGFLTCPACMDRGDGQGERDYVLVGRYLSNVNHRSKTGETPIRNVSFNDAKTGSEAIGNGVHIIDYMTNLTIQMLYLVEYAYGNCRSKIGRGLRDTFGVTGVTDNMLYHTGTTGAKTDFAAVQYRNIEDIWSNLSPWIDGVKFSNGGLAVSKDLVNYEYLGSTITGNQIYGTFYFANKNGFEWVIMPKTGVGWSQSDSERSPLGDGWGNGGMSEGKHYCIGGRYNADNEWWLMGIFMYWGVMSDSGQSYIGSRIIKLP